MSDKNKKTQSRLGLWNKWYENNAQKTVYHDPTTAELAARFINQSDIITVEDWGCGLGGFEDYIGKHQTYIGLDGSNTQFAAKIIDLELYRSSVDAIHMRHVLEHNTAWQTVLINALSSFNKRMALTLFTPYQEKTTVLARYTNFNNTGIDMVDIGFSKDDIIKHFNEIQWSAIDNIATNTQYGIEHIFLLEKNHISTL